MRAIVSNTDHFKTIILNFKSFTIIITIVRQCINFVYVRAILPPRKEEVFILPPPEGEKLINIGIFGRMPKNKQN